MIKKATIIFFLVSIAYNALCQNTIKRIDKNTKTEVSYEQVQKWQDGTPMNNSKVDDVIYIKDNGGFYKREIDNAISVKWFGAKGDGQTDDTQAFEKVLQFLSSAKNNYRVFIPQGEYIIKRKLTIEGENNLPIIQGAGMRNTILNFSQSRDNACLQLGQKNKNSLSGGISDMQIKGNGSNDGLQIYGSAPYGVAWCRFENLFISNVNNGIVDDSQVNFFSSHFSNIHIERYFGTAMVIYGGYNTYQGLFIVQPSGQTNKDSPDRKYGANNLALNVLGGNNSFYDVQSEDQVRISGGYNTFNGLVIEYIVKAQNNKEIQSSAIWVAGANTIFNRLKIIGLKSKLTEYLMSIFSPNVTIMNAMYEDEGRSDQKIKYAFFPSPESSGVMINCIPKTLYGMNNPAFLNDTKNWTYINVMGEGDKLFSRIKNDGYKLSTQERNKLNAVEGMEIYNTTTNTKEYWNGKVWKPF